MIHARAGERGFFRAIKIAPEIADKYLVDMDISIKEGDYLNSFTGANMSIGDMILKFDSRHEMDEVMKREKEWLHILTEK